MITAENDQSREHILKQFTLLSKRWRLLAISLLQKRRLQRQPVRFFERIQAKYTAPDGVLAAVSRRFQAKGLKPSWLPDVPPDLAVLPWWFWLDSASRPSGEPGFPKTAGRIPLNQEARRLRRRDVSFGDEVEETEVSQWAEGWSPKQQGKDEGEPATPIHLNMESTAGRLEKIIERSDYLAPSAGVTDFLAGLLNLRIPRVKIYTGAAADALAKQAGADALTLGEKIVFREGRYDPQTERGLALLGHELTHAAWSAAPSQPESDKGPKAEESAALGNERRVLNYFSGAPVSVGRPALSSPRAEPGTVRTGQIQQRQRSEVKAATTDRDVSLPPESTRPAVSSFQLSEQQLNLIKEEVYRDLMDRMRTDSERVG